MTGTTDRNICKHRDKVLQNIRTAMGMLQDKSGEGTMDMAAIVLFWTLLPTFAIGWEISKRIYPKLKQLVIKKTV